MKVSFLLSKPEEEEEAPSAMVTAPETAVTSTPVTSTATEASIPTTIT